MVHKNNLSGSWEKQLQKKKKNVKRSHFEQRTEAV